MLMSRSSTPLAVMVEEEGGGHSGRIGGLAGTLAEGSIQRRRRPLHRRK